MSKKIIIIALVCVAGFAIFGGYASWYTYNRLKKIEQVDTCGKEPAAPVTTTAPDGNLASIYEIETCSAVVVPPSIGNLVRGRIVFEHIPERMIVNQYSLTDALLGNYTLGSDDSIGCDQSATTTDCSILPPPQPEPQSYIPLPAQPTDTWTSATETPISLPGFSFMLPLGWHVSIYADESAEGIHMLAQRDPNDRGLTIDCPPVGKGFEEATRLSSEERSFIADDTQYSIALEEWASPGNQPWYFLWIRTHKPGDFSTDALGTACLAQGNANSDVMKAFRLMYETWRKGPDNRG